MLDNIDLENSLRLTLFNLMLVLYDCGITEIHLVGLMRILGVSNDKSSEYDDQLIELNDNFVKYVEQINTPRPADQTLH